MTNRRELLASTVTMAKQHNLNSLNNVLYREFIWNLHNNTRMTSFRTYVLLLLLLVITVNTFILFLSFWAYC
jgi:hypothetical protein